MKSHRKSIRDRAKRDEARHRVRGTASDRDLPADDEVDLQVARRMKGYDE